MYHQWAAVTVTAIRSGKNAQGRKDLSWDRGKDRSIYSYYQPCEPFTELWKWRIWYGICACERAGRGGENGSVRRSRNIRTIDKVRTFIGVANQPAKDGQIWLGVELSQELAAGWMKDKKKWKKKDIERIPTRGSDSSVFFIVYGAMGWNFCCLAYFWVWRYSGSAAYFFFFGFTGVSCRSCSARISIICFFR